MKHLKLIEKNGLLLVPANAIYGAYLRASYADRDGAREVGLIANVKAVELPDGREFIIDVPVNAENAAVEARALPANLLAAAPVMLAALELIHANAAESPEWIRERIAPAIAMAKKGGAK